MSFSTPPKEAHSFLEAVVLGFVLAFIVSLLSFFVAYLYAPFVFVVVFFAYLAYAFYIPGTKPGVNIVMLATSAPKAVRVRTRTREEHKYRLARAKPSPLGLKAYIHSKGNRNVLITGSSGQGKSKLTGHLLGEMPYQKLIFSFKAGEEYMKMGDI
ncbi:MAG: hypothetical protein M1544_00525 [Candidatus Marsarchaeota archaeon]|nr:hypothetical protein [Candidatus Marsarchaeota archaeon]